MAGQAGWYRAPGEEGLLRYWDGTTWTHHRQPDLAVVPPEPAAQEEPDVSAIYRSGPDLSGSDLSGPDLSMAEYESQFTPADGVRVVEQPQYRPQAPFVPEPKPEPQLATQQPFVMRQYAPAAPPVVPASVSSASTVPTTASEIDDLLAEVASLGEATTVQSVPVPTLLADSSTTENAPTEAVGAPAGEVLVGFAGKRKRVDTAVKGMGVGILLVLVGLVVVVFLGGTTPVGAGETATSGIVMSLGSAGEGACTPTARFAVTGRSYATGSTGRLSPCPVTLGETVTVIYPDSNPGAGARIDRDVSVTQFLWILPVLGGLLFFASLWIFIARAGSIASGVAMVREDGKRGRESVPTP